MLRQLITFLMAVFVHCYSTIILAQAVSKIPADHYIFHSFPEAADSITGVVRAIMKDSNSFMWIGTDARLYRFDGYNFEDFAYTKDKSLQVTDSWIYDLSEDSKGRLWIATKNGLNMLDLKTKKISQFIAANDNSGAISDNWVYTLYMDDDRLLVGTKGGLDAVNLKTKEVSNLFSGYRVSGIYRDALGNFWISTFTHGLLRYQETLNTLETILYIPDQQGGNNTIYKMAYHNDSLWLATGNGLIKFNIESATQDPEHHILKGNAIWGIIIDRTQQLWISTSGNGLYLYSPATKIIKHFETNNTDNKSLQSKSIRSLYFDAEQNRLWLGDRSDLRFLDLARPTYLLRNQFASNVIWSIDSHESLGLLMGTDKGLSTYNIEFKERSDYTDSGPVYALWNENQNIWFAGLRGLFVLDLATEQIKDMTPHLSDFGKGSSLIIYDIAKSDKQQFLLASNKGLIEWHSKTKRAKLYQFANQLDNGDYQNIAYVLYSHQSKYILGTFSGIYYVNQNTQKLEQYLLNQQQTILSKSPIYAIASDNKGSLWVGTDKGLLKIKDRKIIDHFTLNDGLPDNAIHGIAIRQGNLWVSTNSGLRVFNIQNNHFGPIHLDNHQFDMEFNGKAIYLSQGGVLYFGSQEGILYFDSRLFNTSVVPPVAKITNFRLFNQVIAPGSTTLPEAIEFTNQLKLRHDQSMFAFEFAAMNYTNPNHLYAYQMSNLISDDQWIMTDQTNRLAVFTSQNAGDYTFRVKTGWSENEWSDQVAEIKITVLPPWWLTRWAYTAYVLFMIIVLGTIYKIRTRRIRHRAIELEYEVEQRTRQILDQKNTIEELMNKKNEMFENISHELRTPLTLILGPIKQLKTFLTNDNSKKSLVIAERNTERLLVLVEQLLSLSKTQKLDGKKQTIHNLSNIACDIADFFKSIANSKFIDFTVDVQENLFISATDQSIDEILINLLSNAFKNTSAYGAVVLQVECRGAEVILKVKDNGIGIDETKLDIIFDRFSRLENVNATHIEGTGLGLAIVKQHIEQNKWEIRVDSRLNHGSEFQLKLPLAKSTATDDVRADITKETQKNMHYLQKMLTDFDRDSVALSNVFNDSKKQKTRILIIDDTEDMLCYLQNILQTQFDCCLANNGEHGFILAKDTIPDLIICDIMMPGISGFEVLDELRKEIKTSHIPVIMLTAKGDQQSRLTGLRKLADDYISKPFDDDELKIKIQSILSLQKIRQDKLRQNLLDEDRQNNDQHLLGLTPCDRAFIEKWEVMVKKYYSSADLTVEKLANFMAISSSHLLNKLKALLGKGPKEFLEEFRINEAKRLLKTANLSIAQVADAVGFHDPTYFSARFKLVTQQTPSQYRKQQSLPV